MGIPELQLSCSAFSSTSQPASFVLLGVQGVKSMKSGSCSPSWAPGLQPNSMVFLLPTSFSLKQARLEGWGSRPHLCMGNLQIPRPFLKPAPLSPPALCPAEGMRGTQPRSHGGCRIDGRDVQWGHHNAVWEGQRGWNFSTEKGSPDSASDLQKGRQKSWYAGCLFRMSSSFLGQVKSMVKVKVRHG